MSTENHYIRSSQGGELHQATSASDVTKTEEDKAEPDHEAPPNDERDAESANQPSPNGNSNTKYQHGWRRIVRNFDSSWFVVNMGTGISSILLFNLPYNGKWLQYISYVIFALNVLLFVTFLLISLLRYTLYPRIWGAMVRLPAENVFLGCLPAGFATIIDMICFVCVPAWGGDWWRVAWAFWWIDAVIAATSCIAVPSVIMSIHASRLEDITGSWLLPPIAAIVAAASGSTVGSILPHPNHQLITVIVSYILWGMGVSLAMMLMTIYFLRLTTERGVPKGNIVSTIIPIGPCGMGGFAIMKLGSLAQDLFHKTQTLSASHIYAGSVLYVVGFLVGLVLWAFGLLWLLFALSTILQTPRFPFNISWWGFTFPVGVFALSTVTLAKEIPSAFFRVLGTIFSVAEVVLWMIVLSGTLYKSWTGEMFYAPYLKDIDDHMNVTRDRSRSVSATEKNKRK